MDTSTLFISILYIHVYVYTMYTVNNRTFMTVTTNIILSDQAPSTFTL